MAQVTLRAADELIDRVRDAAQHTDRSMNEYIAFVLDAATNAELAGTEAERLRERLRRADLLVSPEDWPAPKRPPVDRALVEAAGRRAATGKPLSDIIHDDR